MSRSMIDGIIDSIGKSGFVANSMVEHAMAIIFGAEVTLLICYIICAATHEHTGQFFWGGK